MTAKPVDAVFFWPLTGNNTLGTFKAIYGRKPRGVGKATYTKDYHQPRNELARTLETVLGTTVGGEIPVEWRWPGGSDPLGRLKPAADFALPAGRMNLRWETDHAPPPWRLTPNPTATTLSTLKGIPDLDTEDAANVQLQHIVASDEAPWLIAVHLEGEGAVLHARVVLENPQPGREFASWDTLPSSVRDAMDTPQASRSVGWFKRYALGASVTLNHTANRILAAFNDSPNVLLVGPPGTGKTVAMEAVAALYDENATPVPTFDPDVLHGAFGDPTGPQGKRQTMSLTFHPSYAYEHFVMGLLPDVEDGGVTVKPHVGPLLEMATFASKDEHSSLLILDEFNRGNASAIFGDTLALLDRDKRDTAFIETPYAHLEPTTFDGEALSPKTTLPKRLRILAAMNSADRSVAPLDAAMRRRFAIVHVDPDMDALMTHLAPDWENGFDIADPATWTTPEHVYAVAVRVLATLNDRIGFVLGRDFLLGQSVFWHINDGVSTRDEALTALAAALDNRVLGTLALSFVDDDDSFADVMNLTDDVTGPSAVAWHEPEGALAKYGRRLNIMEFRQWEEHGGLEQAILNLLGVTAKVSSATSPASAATGSAEASAEQ